MSEKERDNARERENEKTRESARERERVRAIEREREGEREQARERERERDIRRRATRSKRWGPPSCGGSEVKIARLRLMVQMRRIANTSSYTSNVTPYCVCLRKRDTHIKRHESETHTSNVIPYCV